MKKLFQYRYPFLFIWYVALFYLLAIPISLLVQAIYFAIDPQAAQTIQQLVTNGASEAQLLVATALPTAIVNVSVYTLAAVPMFALLHDELDAIFMRAWHNKKQFVRQVLSGYVVMIALSFVASLLLMALQINDVSANQQGVESLLNIAPFLSVITVVLLAPFVEEIIFRYILINGLAKKLPRWVAGVVSVVLFALIHVLQAGDFINIIPYLALGAGLTIAYLRTDNIMVSIAIHFIQNLIAVFVSLSFF